MQEHDAPEGLAASPVGVERGKAEKGEEAGRMALVNSLDDLADDEVIQVLEEALDISRQHTDTNGTTASALPLSPSPSSPVIPTASPRTAASFVTLILSLRSRPTYRHILSLIPPRTFRALLGYLLHEIGAIHLVHLLLGDILTRSYGRLEIVYAALEVCAGAVEARYVGELVEMLDDSYFGDGGRTLSAGTIRRVLRVVADEEGIVSEQRTIRLVEVFVGTIQEGKATMEDVQLLQRTLIYASLRHQRTAVAAIHQILLSNKWIQDDPSLRKFEDPYDPRRTYTSLGICIALIRTANASLQSHSALEYLLTAYTEPFIHPHSRLRPAFVEAQEETFRCTLAQRDPSALEKMGEVLVLAVTRRVAVDPRIVQAFLRTCDELRTMGVVRRFVRGLWEHGVDAGARSITRDRNASARKTVPEWALPTGRVLAHLLEFMARKETPWTGDDRRMLDWFLKTIEVNPGVLGMDTAGRCLAGMCGLPGGAGVARRIYERLVDDEVPQDGDTARQRMSAITESRIMSKLVKAYMTHPLRDLAFAQAVVHRHIQYSPPLRDLSSADLARLASAFFRIENADAGVRMLKYLDCQTTTTLFGGTRRGLDDKAVSVLQRALKTVPSTQDKTYLELMELALFPREAEAITSKRLLDNFSRKVETAMEKLEQADRPAWRERLGLLRARWRDRYEKKRNERVADGV